MSFKDSQEKTQTQIFRRVFNLQQTSLSLRSSKKHRRSPIFKKCEDLLEELWYLGYRKQISWKVLTRYVEMVCGGFRTTVTDYLGKQPSYYRGRGRAGVLKKSGKHGYLERFGFIKRISPKVVLLIHEMVDRSYHYLQTDVADFSLSFSDTNENDMVGAKAPIHNIINNNNTESERETKKSESILTPCELAVFNAAPFQHGEPDHDKPLRYQKEVT